MSDSSKGHHPSVVHTRYVTCLPGYFSGVGDLFSALVVGHFDPTIPTGKSALAYAVSQALTKTHAILTMTHEYAAALPEEDRLPTDEELDAKDPERKIRRMRGRELRLIHGQDIIRATGSDEMHAWNGFWDQQ